MQPDLGKTNRDYGAFIESKLPSPLPEDRSIGKLPDSLFGFQEALVRWALTKRRAAIFADCGMGKTLIQLVWADQIARMTDRPVLILTPLAVSHQTVTEAHKFGLECHRSKSGEIRPGINVTNYERLHYFDPALFGGVVADESSILKSFDGVRRGEITEFMRKVDYRLLCTATAAPNDYTELGTSSEALGELGHMDMLGRFFKNDQHSSQPSRQWGSGAVWRFKGHAEVPFWRWVCSWARALRRPSDLGFEDDGFILPDLIEAQHQIETRKLAPGMLFAMPAIGLAEQREERRRTINERCEKAAELVAHDRPALVWCHLNDEGDLLTRLIPGAVQVSGKDSDDAKEEKFLAFVRGEIRALVTKPKIGAWGLNFQHCAHIVTFPSHSYEQYYQGIRRCWRFGQQNQVKVDIVLTEGEAEVMASLQRKAKAADEMFSRLVHHMNEQMHIDRAVQFPRAEEVPQWLSSLSA